MTLTSPVRNVAEELERKRSERDELLAWLETLGRENAAPEAAMVVRAELGRVLKRIESLESRSR